MRACLRVDTTALAKNARLLSELSSEPSTFFCPMIKANAYGHGAVPVAKKLLSEGFKNLGVVSVEEALQLKDLEDSEKKIYIFGPLESEELEIINREAFIPVIGRWEDLKNIENSKHEISLHIEFDLGMNRLGFQLQETSALIKYIQDHPDLKVTGICSHLSQGERAGLEELKDPIKDFKKIRDQFQKNFPEKNLQFHLLGSSGVLSLWSHNKQEKSLGFRPGISLYGVKPAIEFAHSEAQKKYMDLDLKKTSSLQAFIVESRNLSVGDKVSYGGTWEAQKKSVVAVVSIGYADGLPYSLSNKTELLFRGKKVPLIGRVCMDFFMIDVSKALEEGPIRKGEEVVIFGSQKNNYISVEEQAQKAGTLVYELFTGLGNRVQREYF